jgi:hypothetical protein
MRVVLSIAALAALSACSSAPKPAAVAAQPAATMAVAAPPAAAPSAGTPVVDAYKLVKGSPEAKAAGLRCERIGTLGTNRKEEICTTRAQRDAERELAKQQKQEFKDFRASQAGVGQ